MKNVWCEAPTGAELPPCYQLAAIELSFGCDKAGGCWDLCSDCIMPVVFWLETKYADDHPVFEIDDWRLDDEVSAA